MFEGEIHEDGAGRSGARAACSAHAQSAGQPHGAAYGIGEAAELLGLHPDRIRRWVRSGLVEPWRTERGAVRLSFRDLAFLRRVRDLDRARISPRRVRCAIEGLRARLPEASDLSGIPLAADGGQVVVRERGTLWSAESGQYLFNFEPPEREASVVSLGAGASSKRRGMGAEDWYRLGCELEQTDAARAKEAYLLAVQGDPGHTDAHVNLGCLFHESGALEDALLHYRRALETRPGDATAQFDLAVVLEDLGRGDEARDAYLAAVEADPACAEAHYNLARLYERAGDSRSAVRHLTRYRRLSRD